MFDLCYWLPCILAYCLLAYCLLVNRYLAWSPFGIQSFGIVHFSFEITIITFKFANMEGTILWANFFKLWSNRAEKWLIRVPTYLGVFQSNGRNIKDYRDAHMFWPSTSFLKFWINFSSYRAFNRCIKPFLRSIGSKNVGC